ncbi:LuxR C-terminal-related transcriptional regulator [Rhodococcus ruber]|uniref:LuxR C-terminal-related transcriptional regulator n=1 Tax=Rhodococcus TaxID=1827 RepID=UPI0004950AC3|nr:MULTISPECIES: LuxR C-terminal-related transcriptional regulator [Rhodococcus]ATQ29192.1 LuxR family transcriptional regulator [Rhodococcus ruber]AWH00630.1 LuxR family transcriptional regulator [Rhodococcus ruber]
MVPTMPFGSTAAGRASSPALRPVGSVGEELERARGVLALAHELLGRGAPADPRTAADLDEADIALEVVEEALTRRLGETAPGAEIARLLGLSQQVGHARVMLRQAELAQRSEAIAGVGRALDALRTVGSVADLVRFAPTHVGELGYQRCMLSRVEGNRWVAKSCYVRNDSALAAEILEVGSRSRTLGHRLIESEIVRRRSPVLVPRAQADDRVDPGFKQVTSTSSYVAAPIMVGSGVFGFVHADSPSDGREVGEFDRTLVRTFSECLGYALERLYYQERLRTIRRQVTAVMDASPDMLDEMIGSNEEPANDSVVALPGYRHPMQSGHPAGNVDLLTRRELEVLAHMAEGDSNARIANRLFISEATVKAHVRHILRKLGAANRAEAVSRYLRAG